MITVLIRLLTLNAQNVIPEVLWALLVIYLGALLVTISSVWVTNSSAASRLIWLVVVIAIPFLGIISHCLRCLMLADISMLKAV
jgi:membrane protein DedA with SNARE-associated domain